MPQRFPARQSGDSGSACLTRGVSQKNMAHSIQQFGGRAEVINDLDLMALFIVLREISQEDQMLVPPLIAWEHSRPGKKSEKGRTA